MIPYIGGPIVSECFRDKVVIVIGASRGLGKAIALGCAKHGARVALLARSTEQLEQVAEEARQMLGQACPWPTDIREVAALNKTVQAILAQWGRVDVLINAAGVKVEGLIEQASREEITRALETNFIGPMAACKAVIPAMRKQGYGQIINVSSVLGKRATPHRGVYSASKAALNALTEALRIELKDAGVNVTLVCPGRLLETDGSRSVLLAMTVEQAAKRIIGCIQRPRRELVLTPAGRLLVSLNRWSPGLADWILSRWRSGEQSSPSPSTRSSLGGCD